MFLGRDLAEQLRDLSRAAGREDLATEIDQQLQSNVEEKTTSTPRKLGLRFRVFTDEQAKKLTHATSVEKARSANRRAVARGELEAKKTAGGLRYYAITGRAQAEAGHRIKKITSHGGLWSALGTTEFCADSGERLLLRDEVHEAFKAIKESLGFDLDVPGVVRERTTWWGDRLSRILVDLSQPHHFHAGRFVKRLATKEAKLAVKSSGWSDMIDAGGFAWTILSPLDREREILAAHKKLGVKSPVRCVHVPLLRSAWGGGA